MRIPPALRERRSTAVGNAVRTLEMWDRPNHESGNLTIPQWIRSRLLIIRCKGEAVPLAARCGFSATPAAFLLL
ncbi:MAG: hypothetical protein JWP21_3028 [Tardiphaga sp.]|nr:hypothetical protein [Tardiphaga sp.]